LTIKEVQYKNYSICEQNWVTPLAWLFDGKVFQWVGMVVLTFTYLSELTFRLTTVLIMIDNGTYCKLRIWLEFGGENWKKEGKCLLKSSGADVTRPLYAKLDSCCCCCVWWWTVGNEGMIWFKQLNRTKTYFALFYVYMCVWRICCSVSHV